MRLLTMLRTRLFGDADPAKEPGQEGVCDSHPIPPASDLSQGSQSAVPPEPQAASETAEVVAARQARTADRILGDERLRGDLTDDEFQPLLTWALSVTDRLATSTNGMSELEADARIDAGVGAIQEIIGAAEAAIVAHAEGDADRRSSELAFLGERSASWQTEGVDVGDGQSISHRLRELGERLDAEPGLPGPEVATLIVGALRSPTDDRSRLHSPSPSQGGYPGGWGVGDPHQENPL